MESRRWGKMSNIGGVAVSSTAWPWRNWLAELIVSPRGVWQLLVQHAIATWTLPPQLCRQNICPPPQCRILRTPTNLPPSFESLSVVIPSLYSKLIFKLIDESKLFCNYVAWTIPIVWCIFDTYDVSVSGSAIFFIISAYFFILGHRFVTWLG